jgi:hypothetical protein
MDPPQSGHLALEYNCPPSFDPFENNPSCVECPLLWELTKVVPSSEIHLVNANATASGVDRTKTPSSHAGQQVIPRNCSTTSIGSIPDLKERDAILDIASN